MVGLRTSPNFGLPRQYARPLTTLDIKTVVTELWPDELVFNYGKYSGDLLHISTHSSLK